MLDAKYAFRELRNATPEVRAKVLLQLSGDLAARLGAGSDFAKDILSIIDDLRALGHDLWNFDQDDDWQIWSYDYATPRPGAGLFVRFDKPSRVEASWTEPTRPDRNSSGTRKR